MPKNRLYLVINRVFINERAPLTGVNAIVAKRHKSGALMLILGLPAFDTSIAGYTLLNHHISIFESSISNSRIDAISQYHYTAVFKNADEKKYFLHVYFDKKDKIISRPFLSLKTADGFESVLCDDEQLSRFEELAKENSQGLISVLRTTQQQLIDQLQTKYAQLEKLAVKLSIDLEKNKKLYVQVLDQQLAVLTELKLYKNIQNQPAKLIADIETRKATLLQSKPELKTPEEPPQSPQSPVEEMVILDTAPAPKKPEISPNIVMLQEEFARIKLLGEDEQLEFLPILFRKVIEKELEVEAGVYSVTEQDLINLSTLKNDLENFALAKFESLYKGRHFTKVQKLNAFYHLVPETLIAEILPTDDEELIGFFLTEKLISVNAKNFTIAGQTYTSIREFYLLNNGSRCRPKCFGVFVKHGFNVTEVDEQTGLPFAGALQLVPLHPLTIVLTENTDLTIDKINFYKQVNQGFKAIVNQPEYASVKKPIEDQIAANNKSIQVIHLKIELNNIDKEFKRKIGNSQQLMKEKRLLLDRRSEIQHEISQAYHLLVKHTKKQEGQHKQMLAALGKITISRWQRNSIPPQSSTLNTPADEVTAVREERRERKNREVPTLSTNDASPPQHKRYTGDRKESKQSVANVSPTQTPSKPRSATHPNDKLTVDLDNNLFSPPRPDVERIKIPTDSSEASLQHTSTPTG
jgi:hypothetical protein